MKKILSILIAVMFITTTAAWGGSWSGGSRSSSSSSFSGSKPSSSSWGGSSKPSATTSTPSSSWGGSSKSDSKPAATTSSGSWFGGSKPDPKPATTASTPSSSWGGSSKQGDRVVATTPVTKPTESKPVDVLSRSRADSIQKAESKKAFTEYQAQFKKPTAAPATSPSDNTYQRPVVVKKYYTSYNDYTTSRDRYYHGWTRPRYMYDSYTSFGPWDAAFLWWMMDNERERDRWFYDHQHDVAVQQFLAESRRISAENAALKQKMAGLETNMAQMQQQGVKVDESYMPPDMDPALAMRADDAVKEESSGGFLKFLGWSVAIILIVVVGALVVSVREKRKY